MKTKHLLFSVALVGALAACSNEDFLSEAPSAETGIERPSVENVTLSIANDAETRMVFDNGYEFIDGDQIAALLMDENNTGFRYGSSTLPADWYELSWLERYKLVDYIHTCYPFTFKATENVFDAGCNMLEGNYFLVAPYDKFAQRGERQAYIEIGDQVQQGDNSDALKKTMADNQVMIGYAKLDASGGSSQIETALSPVLCPIRINIALNGGQKEYKVTKLVLHHPQLSAQLHIDPTRAPYSGTVGKYGEMKKEAKWNLWDNGVATDVFNYANYLNTYFGTGYEKELYKHDRYASLQPADYVWNVYKDAGNASEGRVEGKYYYSDAVRAVVQPLQEFNETAYENGYVQLNLKDAEGNDGMVLKDGGVIKTLVMVPPFNVESKEASQKDLYLTIYTEDGLVQDINLSNIWGSKTENVQTSNAILYAVPDKFDNIVTVTLDNDAIKGFSTDMVIDNGDDLKHMVQWAIAQNTTAKITARINNDIVVNDELAALIKQLNANCHLAIEQFGDEGNNLVFTTTKDQADVLEKIDVASDVTVEVGSMEEELREAGTGIGVLELSAETRNINDNLKENNLNIVVSEVGTLNIVGENTVQGGYNMSGTTISNYSDVNIENKGTLNVTAKQVLGVKVINKAEMNIEGSIYVAPESQNTVKGEIAIKVGATLSGTTNKNFKNYGKISNSGKAFNMLNEANDSGILPGVIYVETAETETWLNGNKGYIVYNVLTPVKWLTGTAPEGRLFYSPVQAATGQLELTDLDEAYVTDAKVTNGSLIIDRTGGEAAAYLQNLAVINVTVTTPVTVTGQKILRFASDGNLVMDGGSVKNIDFVLRPSEESKNYVKITGNVEWKGEVNFLNSYGTPNEYATLKLADAEITNNADVEAETVIGVEGHNSNIINNGSLSFVTAYDADNVNINNEDPAYMN